jgi:hypothetical protein
VKGTYIERVVIPSKEFNLGGKIAQSAGHETEKNGSGWGTMNLKRSFRTKKAKKLTGTDEAGPRCDCYKTSNRA